MTFLASSSSRYCSISCLPSTVDTLATKSWNPVVMSLSTCAGCSDKGFPRAECGSSDNEGASRAPARPVSSASPVVRPAAKLRRVSGSSVKFRNGRIGKSKWVRRLEAAESVDGQHKKFDVRALT